MSAASRGTSMAVVASSVLALGVSGFVAAGGLFAAGADPTGRRPLAALWAVLMLVAVVAAAPSLRLIVRGPATPAALVPAEERRRQCRRAEMGAFAWLLLAVVWLAGSPLETWSASGTALSVLAGAACIPASVALFREWARLRG